MSKTVSGEPKTYAEAQAAAVGLDVETWSWFDRTYRGVPAITAGHVPTIKLNRRGTGLTGTCSCGARLNRSSGCNWPGLVCSALVGFEKYQAHVKATEAEAARLLLEGAGG